MNRRKALTGLVSGGLAALTLPKRAEAVLPSADCSPATAAGVFERDVLCLPEGLVEVTTPRGDVVEIVVPASGKIVLRFRGSELLHGLWEIVKPGDWITNKIAVPGVPYDPMVLNCFTGLVDSILLAGSYHEAHVSWVYRHPLDYPGTMLRGVLGSPMRLALESTEPDTGPVTVDLVEYDLDPQIETELRLIPYPPLPHVRQVLKTWTVPAWTGRFRNFAVSPVRIPWNARFLGIIRRTPVVDGLLYVRLRSILGPLRITTT